MQIASANDRFKWARYREHLSRSIIPLEVGSEQLDLKESLIYRRLPDFAPELIPFRQRGEGWFAARAKKVNFSAFSNIIGWFGQEGALRAQVSAHELKSKKEIEEDEISLEIGKENMAFGSFHEIDGVATLIKFLGRWDCSLILRETVSMEMNLSQSVIDSLASAFAAKYKRRWTASEEGFFLSMCRSSPDGVIVDKSGKVLYAVELKSPHGRRKPEPYTKVPYYYIPQCIAEADVLGATGTLFMAWGPETSNLWFIPACPDFLEQAIPLLFEWQDEGRHGRYQSKFPVRQAAELLDYAKALATGARLIAVLPSVYSKQRENELK